MRSAIDSPIAAPSSTKNSDARWTPAIQLVDLALDFPLAKGEGHRDEHIRPGGAHRRGGEHVVERPDRILADEARLTLQDDRAIDVVGRAGREDTGGEQRALGGGGEPRPAEHVDVLIDDLADPDHPVVVERAGGLGAAAEARVEILDDSLRDGRGPGRLALDIGLQQVREVGPDHERQGQDRDDGREDEREEQLAVEAGADLAQQRTADARALAGDPREQRGADEHDQERRGAERRQLRQVHEVIEQGEDRIADGEDPLAVVGEIDLVLHAGGGGLRPERLPRAVEPVEQRIGDRPGRTPRGVDRLEAPAVDRDLDVATGSAFLGGDSRRPHDLVVGILRRDEGQRFVLEEDVQDDGALLRPHAGGVDRADAALGVQHAPLLGAEWRDFDEHVPLAAGAALDGGRGVFGDVQRKAADELAAPVVQLHRRRQTLASQSRLPPDEERRVARGRILGGLDADEIGQRFDGVDLAARLLGVAQQRLHVVLRLDGVLASNELASRALGEEIHRRVEQQRRDQERQEERENPRRHRGPAIAGSRCATRPARRARRRWSRAGARGRAGASGERHR